MEREVVFIPSLWLKPSCWDRWDELFANAGYPSVRPDWPASPRTFDDVVDYFEGVIRARKRMPAVIGHSLGGLIAEVLAGRGTAEVTVAIAPAPPNAPMPYLITAEPPSYERFRASFANAVDENEAKQLYAAYVVAPRSAASFELTPALIDPQTEDRLEKNPVRGPLMIVSGENDLTVPSDVARDAFNAEDRDGQITDFAEMPGRGHSLTIDGGWLEVATMALSFVEQYAPVGDFESLPESRSRV